MYCKFQQTVATVSWNHAHGEDIQFCVAFEKPGQWSPFMSSDIRVSTILCDPWLLETGEETCDPRLLETGEEQTKGQSFVLLWLCTGSHCNLCNSAQSLGRHLSRKSGNSVCYEFAVFCCFSSHRGNFLDLSGLEYLATCILQTLRRHELS